jgi:NitT/TauT family transport system substrate-binding protein
MPGPKPSPSAPRPLAWLSAVLLIPLLAGCLDGFPTLTLPVEPWAGFAYFPLAQQQGFDRAAGLHLRTVPYDDSKQIGRAWQRGELSVAPLTSVEVVNICSRRPDRCPVVVLVLDESRGADQLIVRSSISDLRQLRGRRVGLAPSGLGPFLTSRALESVGLDISDVRLVPMAPKELASALNNGRIDAAATYPPFSDLVLQLGIARVAFDSRALPGQILDLLVVDRRFLAEHRQDLARLLLAWEWSHAWARRDPEATGKTLAALQRTSVSGLRRVERSLRYYPLVQQRQLLAEGGSVAEALEAVQEVQQDLGMVRDDAPLPAVSDALVETALQLAARASAPK